MVCLHAFVCLQHGAMYSHWPSVPAAHFLWFVQVEHGNQLCACQQNMVTWLGCAYYEQKHMCLQMSQMSISPSPDH